WFKLSCPCSRPIRNHRMRFALCLCLLQPLLAAPPFTCPAGAPLGTFQITAAPPGGGARRQLQTINQLLPGYRISYVPVKLNSPDKKKTRISLVLLPSDHGKVKVFDPERADAEINWTVPFRTEIAAVVYGPQGLNRKKVDQLIAKNDELVGQLADYAQKTEQTQALIQAITQEQQALDTGKNVNAAVVSFANQFPGTKLDRTQPADQQMLALVHSINPALSAYDPLAPSASQRAAQSAGLAAAVAGLFFGTNVGLAASGGALLLNMHSLFFPGTEFRSSFAETLPEQKTEMALCGNKTPSASRTELAYLWATRVPDSGPPEIALTKTEHLPLGAKSAIPVSVHARNDSLVARVQDWKLVSEDGKLAVPAAVKFNSEAKTLDVDATDPKLKPALWKLAGEWDSSPLTITGQIELHPFSTFEKARLTATSQDQLTEGSGKCIVVLEGDDFEFMEKLSFKSLDDKFAQPAALPFHLPRGARAGPQTTLETQVDAGALPHGRYQFLLAQSDGKPHEVPFKILPAPPTITNLPLFVNTGVEPQHFTLQGTGLDRIAGFTAEGVQISFNAPNTIAIKAEPGLKDGTRIALQMKVTDFAQPIGLPGALVIAGPRPEISAVRPSQAADTGVVLRPGEIPAGQFVSFALDLSNTPNISSLRLACPGSAAVVLKAGTPQLQQQGPGALFLSFNPSTVGPPGCTIMAEAVTPASGTSAPKRLGAIVRLPHIDSFEISDQKAGENTWLGLLRGQDLDTIERVGWDPATGTPVTAIPTPLPGGNGATLQVSVPWPAPAPHAPLYIWLRGESAGRITSVKW
ncbi:MAG: hypothetical protein QOJ99_748, partial [Bryobacterales bacterium]|nr:hypothetical protein [Bryobacterales bacterium]